MYTNSDRIIWSFILKEKQGKLSRWKNGLRRGRKKQISAFIININNFEGKEDIKFVFTLYFMSFWPVQFELEHIEISRLW